MSTEARCSVLIQVCVRCTCRPWKLRPSRLLTSGGCVWRRVLQQSLDRDAQLHQAFLLQDVVRKTQFVLGDQSQGRQRGQEKKRRKCRSSRKETRAAKDLEVLTSPLAKTCSAHTPGLHWYLMLPGNSHSPTL